MSRNEFQVLRPGRLVPRFTAAMLVAIAFALSAMAGAARAQHFDVELRTDKGPVAGSRIVTDFYGDLDLAGRLPFDAVTGYRIFPAYFGDFAGGLYATANPGFQAFAGAFVQGEEIHFRALGTLLYWTPASGKWTAAPAGVKLTLYGGIPAEVILGYSTDPVRWADQYAYYQAGTRYDGQGITGPLTALIDDAKTNGTFHSHLDWKISSASGTPPVGAYMLTLELWSPTLSGGQPKYLASQPFHVIFERGITEAQMLDAFNSRVSPSCEGRSLSWYVGGNACSASVATTASGSSAVASDQVAPATGSATFACTNGTWGPPTNASCELPPPASCQAATLAWTVGGNSCSASVGTAQSGSSALATDSAPPTTGTALFACFDGTWGAASQASCSRPAPAACKAQSVTWKVGGTNCSGDLPATPSGSSAQVTDDVPSATGQATFTCTDGTWSGATRATCAEPLPNACPGKELRWTVGTSSCSAVVGSAASGSAVAVHDGELPTLGDATFTCTNGAWNSSGNASCITKLPAACPSQVLAWQVGQQSCSASAAETPSGGSALVTDAERPTTGSATFACTDGTWAVVNASCIAAPVKPPPPARMPTPPWAPPAQLPWEKPRR